MSCLLAWHDLRGALTSPTPVAEYAAGYPEEATHLAQARSIAAFMAGAGTNGFECWENVLRHFGEDLNGTHSDDTKDLGEREEWPPGLEETHAHWDAAMARAAGISKVFTAALSTDGANTTNTDLTCGALVEDLQEIAQDIGGASTFANPSAQSEMIQEVQSTITQVKGAWWDYRARAAALDPGDDTSSQTDDATFDPTDEEDVSEEEPEVPDLTATGQLDAQVAQALGLLQQNKSSENALIAQAANPIGVLGVFDSGLHAAIALSDITKQACDLWELWIRQIQDLRDVYAQLDLPGGQWKVSPGPHVARRMDYEPDPDKFVDTCLATQSDGDMDSSTLAEMQKIRNDYSVY